MPFKRRGSAATVEDAQPAVSQSTAPQGQAQPSEKKLSELIEVFAGQCSAALQSSMLLEPDNGYLEPPLIKGLEAVAKKLGVDYDPAVTSTFYFVVTETAAKFLSGPALVRVGDTPAIRWGNQMVEIDPAASLYSDEWRIISGGENSPTTLIYDPKGLAMPISVKPDVSSADEAKEFLKVLPTIDTFEGLVTWLRNGVSAQGLYKLEDGQAIEIQSVSDEIESKSGESKYRIIEAIYEDDSPCRFYVSDADNVSWGRLEFPAVATRNGGFLDIEQPSGNLAYQIKFPVMKMGEALSEGKSYKLLGYEEEQGKFGLQVNLSVEINGEAQKVRANKALVGRVMTLKSQGQDNFTENPGNLIVDAIKRTKDGKIRVNARIITKADLENPLMAKLMRANQQAAS